LLLANPSVAGGDASKFRARPPLKPPHCEVQEPFVKVTTTNQSSAPAEIILAEEIVATLLKDGGKTFKSRWLDKVNRTA